MAAFFANQHDVINLEGLVDFNLDSLIDVIPAGVIRDAKDITVCACLRVSLGEPERESLGMACEKPWTRLKATDLLHGSRKRSARLSHTTLSLLACTSNLRASLPSIQSLWSLASSPQAWKAGVRRRAAGSIFARGCGALGA